MTDIVERLRYPIITGNPDSTVWIHEEYAVCRNTMKEAADEIERLREEKATLQHALINMARLKVEEVIKN